MNSPAVPGFVRRDGVKTTRLELPVYVSEKGNKPLIVVHELPGMTPVFIDYCQQMVGEGYKVYMPLIFNDPGTEMGGLACARFCLSKEFNYLFKMQSDNDEGRAFPEWLLRLTKVVTEEHLDCPVGVIGMCLTGAFVIVALAQKQVAAVVACQPAFPFKFWKIATLGLTDQQRKNSAARAATLPKPCATGYRYKFDYISRGAHLRAIKKLLGDGFHRHPGLNYFGHSTVTGSNAGKNKLVFDKIVKFLETRI